MSREVYISYRNTGSYPLRLYYEYFKLNGGELNEDSFNKNFILFSGALNNSDMVKYYDDKYEVIFLYKNNQLIKIY